MFKYRDLWHSAAYQAGFKDVGGGGCQKRFLSSRRLFQKFQLCVIDFRATRRATLSGLILLLCGSLEATSLSSSASHPQHSVEAYSAQSTVRDVLVASGTVITLAPNYRD